VTRSGATDGETVRGAARDRQSADCREARSETGGSIVIAQGNLSNRNPFCLHRANSRARRRQLRGQPMNGLIYLIGLIVVIMAILSFFGLR
jgi:hypothetical protein